MSKNNLPNWKKYSTGLKNGKNAKDFGFKCKDGDLSRVNARYRLAKSFQAVMAETYTQSTLNGYSALMKAMLTYSAFESYVNAVYGEKKPFDYKMALQILNQKDLSEIGDRILILDKNRKFYAFLIEHSSSTIKQELKNFYDGNDHNSVYLLASIRHIFAHGSLTPNVKGIKPKKVVSICTLLSDFFLKEIGNHFATLIEVGVKKGSCFAN